MTTPAPSIDQLTAQVAAQSRQIEELRRRYADLLEALLVLNDRTQHLVPT